MRNCQSTPLCLAFVLSDHAAISFCSSASSPMRRSLKHWLVRQLSSHSATFGRVAELDSLYVSTCPLWLECLVERAFTVRVQVVAHQGHALTIRIARVQHLS